ncbi:MAG TPA: hypothetical protein VEL47_00335 [Myxococcota bacterium]|nr:hypothetical protein [Myxococcota bacterium]
MKSVIRGWVFSISLIGLISLGSVSAIAAPVQPASQCAFRYDERSCILTFGCWWDDFAQICSYDPCTRHHHHHSCLRDPYCTWDYEAHICERDN